MYLYFLFGHAVCAVSKILARHLHLHLCDDPLFYFQFNMLAPIIWQLQGAAAQGRERAAVHIFLLVLIRSCSVASSVRWTIHQKLALTLKIRTIVGEPQCDTVTEWGTDPTVPAHKLVENTTLQWLECIL